MAHDTFDQGPAFQHVCRQGYIDIMQRLLSDGRVDPAADNNKAIRVSIENGNIEVVRLLLADGRADPTAGNNYAIRYSSERGTQISSRSY